MCCWNQFAERAGKCKPKPSSIIYSLAHRSMYSKPFSLIHLRFLVTTLCTSGTALRKKGRALTFREFAFSCWDMEGNAEQQINKRKFIAGCKIAAEKVVAERWERSGQGVGVWLAMAWGNFSLEKRSSLENVSWVDGEDKTHLAVSRWGWAFQSDLTISILIFGL